MTDIRQILFGERKHRKNIESNFHEIIGILESAHNLFLLSADESKLKYDKGFDANFHKVYLLSCMKINSYARSIYHAIATGWYVTASALYREIDDTFLKIVYITNYPDESQLLIKNKLNNKKIRNELRNRKINIPLSEKYWGQLSQMKHGEINAITAYGEEKNGNNILRFHANYDALTAKLLFLALIDYFIWILEHFTHFFRYKYNSQFEKNNFIECFEKLKKDRNNIGNDYPIS